MTRITIDGYAHGQTAGSLVTLGNFAALGDVPDAITTAGDGTAKATYEGTDLFRFDDPSSSTSNVVRFDYNNRFAGSMLSIEWELPYGATPTAEHRYVTVRNAANTADVARVVILSAADAPANTMQRKVRVQDGTGVNLVTSTVALPSGAGCRFHVGIRPSTGFATVNVYTGSDGKTNTAADTVTVTGATWNGSTDPFTVRLGLITSAASATQDVRNIRVDDTTTDPLGVLVQPAPTTIAGGGIARWNGAAWE